MIWRCDMCDAEWVDTARCWLCGVRGRWLNVHWMTRQESLEPLVEVAGV